VINWGGGDLHGRIELLHPLVSVSLSPVHDAVSLTTRLGQGFLGLLPGVLYDFSRGFLSVFNPCFFKVSMSSCRFVSDISLLLVPL